MASKAVGPGEKIPLERRSARVQIANRRRVSRGGQELLSLHYAQALRRGRDVEYVLALRHQQLEVKDIAARDPVEYLNGASRFIEAVFAGLQCPAARRDPRQ